MRKEFEIQGCIEVPPEVTEDEFWNTFIGFVESKDGYLAVEFKKFRMDIIFWLMVAEASMY